LQFGGRGVPAGALSLGTRYTHSPVEVLGRADLDAAVRLPREVLLALPEADLRYMAFDD